MPKLPTLTRPAVERLKSTLAEVRPLSNEYEHLGRRHRIIRGKYRGYVGEVVKVVTARDSAHPEEIGCRGVYYGLKVSVNGAEKIVTGFTWEDLIEITTRSK